MICDIPKSGETRLSLDGHPRRVTNSSRPLFFFWTRDIRATKDFLTDLGIESDGTISDIGSLSFLIFRDPDNNQPMVCQPN
jgi:hypothetical protein